MAVIRSEDCGSSLFRLRIRDFMLNIYLIAYLKYILDNLILKVVFSKK